MRLLACHGSWCSSDGAPKWLRDWASPRRLLALLCCLNLVFFLDRGVVASNGVNGTAEDTSDKPGISATFNLSLFQDGLVAALYYVGVMFGAPIFAQLSKHYNVLRLLGAGAALFAVAALICGFSQTFAMVLVFRCLVGAATGSLIALGPPLIDDHAPAASRALWLGVFYLCMPTGVALGYLFGGAVGSGLTWRAAFWIEAGLAVPFSLWCLLAPPVDIRRQAAAAGDVAPAAELALLAGKQEPSSELAGGSQLADGLNKLAGQQDCTGDSSGNGSDLLNPPQADRASGSGSSRRSAPMQQQHHELHHHQQLPAAAAEHPGAISVLSRVGAVGRAFFLDLCQLARHPVCICVILGLTAWNGFIGAYGYYGPKAVLQLFSIDDPENADFVFGVVLAASGILGSLAGGLLFDALGGSMPRGMLLGAASLATGCVLAVVAVAGMRTQAAFWPVFGLAQFAVFIVQAPANAVCMWSVPAGLRPFALSISEVMQHALGDIPSPPALGAMQGAVDNWRLSLAVFALLPAIGAVAFLAGALLARHARDYRLEEHLLADTAVAAAQGQEQQLLLASAAVAAAGTTLAAEEQRVAEFAGQGSTRQLPAVESVTDSGTLAPTRGTAAAMLLPAGASRPGDTLV